MPEAGAHNLVHGRWSGLNKSKEIEKMNTAGLPAKAVCITAALIAAFLVGCASKGPSISPKEITWKNVPAGYSVLYLLRAPHDSSVVVASVDEAGAVTLPAGSYTALTVAPGPHRLATKDADGTSLEVEMKADERRFFYLSGTLSTPTQGERVAGAVAGPVIALALATQNRTAAGSRHWTECNDLDARGLASIATYVTPDSSNH